jgi:folate-dependent phosphoribosylglycinamide formyltransferase PurN
MRVLLLTHSFNSLAQRIFVELEARGHDVSVEFDIHDSVTEEAVALFKPDCIVAPFLKRAIPERVWRRLPCFIVHPGIVGDRGPTALDWAILKGLPHWGVTVLQAEAEMDGGPVWASAAFEMREATKSCAYYGRKRHGQGTDRESASLQQLALEQTLCGRELRGASRRTSRKRIVRSPERRIHRRGGRSYRAVRARGRRQHLPRRNRRDLTGLPGQAPARVAGRRNSPRGRQADPESGRARDRCEPGPRSRGGSRALPRGSLRQARRCLPHHSASSRKANGYVRPAPAKEDALSAEL